MRLVGAVLCRWCIALAAAEPASKPRRSRGEGARQGRRRPRPRKPRAGRAAARRPRRPPRPTRKAATKPATKAASATSRSPTPTTPFRSPSAWRSRATWSWTGDYNGLVNGEFGERAIAAVKAFQKRNGGKETGVLNQPERAALAAAAKPKQEAVGWRIVDDAASGARLGMPSKLVPQASHDHRRHALGVGARRVFGRELPDRAARHDARRRVRAHEEGAGRPQGRLQRDARQFLRHLRPAEPEEVLCARASARRGGARHHRPVRPGDGRHHGAGRGRDVERVPGVSRRRRRGAAATPQGRVCERRRGRRPATS